MSELKRLKVMIVEDEQGIRDSMAEALEMIFGEIITAKHGDEGLKKFKKYSPNIVVTDISMPIMDGLDMTKEIKDISASTPIIALSAFSEKEKLLKAIDVGIDKYLLKPIDMDELIVSITELAKRKIDTLSDVKFGDGFRFNTATKELFKGDEHIALTKKELAFISLLVERLGTLVLHEDIKKHVWLGDSVNDTAIRTFVKRVRDKVGDETIKNVPGLGYKIEI